MLKQTFWVSFLSLFVITLPATSLAITVQEVPNPRHVNGGWVTDKANMLSPATKVKLNQMISQLEAKNGSEIAVVTVPQTAPAATPKEFATNLFNYWHIGKKGKDNGVLLLISKGERRVEIETGYGVEALLPDARIGNIIQQKITPRFKQRDFDGGALSGTKALVVALEGDAAVLNPSTTNAPVSDPRLVEPSPDANEPKPFGWLAGIGGGGVALAVIAYTMSRRPVFIEPQGRSRSRSRWEAMQPLRCATCRQPMEKLDSTSLLPHLSQPEQVAQKLGSVKFVLYQCPNCSKQLTGQAIHIRAYASGPNQFSTCPTCQELTVTRNSKILKHATEYQEGRRLVTYDCHCCSYHKETEEWIPRLPPPPPPPPPSSSSGSSSSFSGGGDSFGGGSSGGGGAGGSW